MSKTKRRRSIKAQGTKFACNAYGIIKDNRKNLTEREFYSTYDNNEGEGNKLYQAKAKHCIINNGMAMWGEIDNRSYRSRKARHLVKKSLRRSLKDETCKEINDILNIN